MLNELRCTTLSCVDDAVLNKNADSASSVDLTIYIRVSWGSTTESNVCLACQLVVPAGPTECSAVASVLNQLPGVAGVDCVRILSAFN